MLHQPLRWVLLLGLLDCAAAAQVLNFPVSTDRFGNRSSVDAIATAQLDYNLFTINSQTGHTTPLQTPSGSISMLDLKAPGKARREFEKGYQFLMRKDFQNAVTHLAKAIDLYPKFVAAHNALGSAYLAQNLADRARGEFALATGLDDHLPNSFLNLGCAQLALQQFPAAEDSLQKAAALAPLDLQVQIALSYGEFVNHDYPAVLTTAHQVHQRKHEGAALVHYFAAAALEAQNNLIDAQYEMEILLREDPNSPTVDQFRQILQAIKEDQAHQTEAKLHPAPKITYTIGIPTGPNAAEVGRQAQLAVQIMNEKDQIAAAEAEPDAKCNECGTAVSDSTAISDSGSERASKTFPRPVFRATVDEVSIVFAATDHGKPVMNLTATDIGVRDDSRPPNAILGFRNESELPLRLGLVIDASNSITDRLRFEQAAAAKFLQKVVTNKDDLSFVISVNNSVLLVQDFTSDLTATAHAVNQIAPGGGTAMWDAIAFAADKLASRPEIQHVARILVVISDGEDNSSSATLKDAIEHAQHGEVAVYSVSTRDLKNEEESAIIGERTLKTLSELTGGAALAPGSARRLDGSLTDLEQVIRSRYLITYKPASFRRDGRFRAIDIKAEKDGHPLRVYARKGYYASVAQAGSADR